MSKARKAPFKSCGMMSDGLAYTLLKCQEERKKKIEKIISRSFLQSNEITVKHRSKKLHKQAEL